MSPDTRAPRLPIDTDLVRFVIGLSSAKRRRFVASLSDEDAETLDRAWVEWAHEGQKAPDRDWTTWVIKAGRGFGKTLAGAQWLTGLIAGAGEAGGGPLSIALVGATLDDARRVMVEGRSGLLTVAQSWVEEWQPSMRRLRFTTGAEATIFSGASPDLLRGPEHHLAWCDELAKWEHARACWDMLQLGLRLPHPLTGQPPRALVTTTPQTGSVLRAIIDAPGTAVTDGRTARNPHLSAAWKVQMAMQYAGTRLGRQELDGELLPDAGALWTVELIERCRMIHDELRPRHPRESRDPSPVRASCDPDAVIDGPELGPHVRGDDAQGMVIRYTRTLIAVDPPSGDGTCGIIACARDTAGIAHVLADHSVTARSPEGWARAVADACALHGTDEVIAEGNQGGKMVKAVLLTADARLRVRLVTATTGKTTRAEPVAMAFEAGKVRLHGRMPELEAQLLGMIAGGGYEGPGASPDRADAMVWGVSEVMKGRGEARVRDLH